MRGDGRLLREANNISGEAKYIMFVVDIILWGKDPNKVQEHLDIWPKLMKARSLSR